MDSGALLLDVVRILIYGLHLRQIRDCKLEIGEGNYV